MNDLGVDQWVNVAGSTLAFFACATFAVIYHVKAPWWRSQIGRNLMGFAAAIAALFLYTVLITLWPEGCAATVLRSLRTAVACAVVLLMAQRARLVIRAQHPPKHQDRTGV
ncbi:hypothetical protein F3K34_43665 [Streptomyces sp. LBUM 1486]|uniref:putative phage holin n=1 Tax=Streptomyces scabiei TaxID=1930 RepID=UPI001B331433|nr:MULTISPECIES: hypothetical protein [Streptomyces]MBP5918685.1 hypothetical protein [Streptomyces sp. LBUM 1486]MDX2800193.1 hypothetical protein [Streptomyces scabiei]MDX3126962.1 hypothetical protein [Streptomyces scabiei]